MGVAGALAMLDRALDALAGVDAASLPAAVRADALRALERAQSRQTAVQARVLSAFMHQDDCATDGQGSAKAWLRWQTRVTRPAAGASIGWARRLGQHPGIAAALAGGELSASWAKAVCGWTDRLPASRRADADAILLEAARGGVDLNDLAGLAQEMWRRTAGPDDAGDDGFADRYLNVGVTWRGAGRVDGDLTPGCTAALTAVVEALSKKTGPEDDRTAAQRRHDALEEACRRLIAAGMVPGRAGQPIHLQVHMTLSQLRDLPGAAEAEAQWAAARASEPGWLTGPEADAAACDATVIPVVSGHPDPAALDHLTGELLTGSTSPSGAGRAGAGPGDSSHDNGPDPGQAAGAAPPGTASARSDVARTGTTGTNAAGTGTAGTNAAGTDAAGTSVTGTVAGAAPAGACHPQQLTEARRQRLRRALVGLAAQVLSGPGGLAARLRAGLDAELATPSLPLDIGTATDLIPAHLRRAATARHRHCAFPGCDQPASVCHLHHLIPRRDGGPTSLDNLMPLCGFHHLIAIHRWGWKLTLHPDATTTATSPDGTRTLHSHGPPAQAA
ncbi:MAG: DUF222 domain-containing protein [Gemmatimonadota bacterium]